MTKTEKMSKARKFFKANKALTAFFTVVLIIGLFPIGMAAFGGSDGVESAAPTEAESATSSAATPEVEGDVVPGPSGMEPEEIVEMNKEAQEKEAAEAEKAADPAALAEDPEAVEEEEPEEADEPIAIDTSKAEIIIRAADPDDAPAAGNNNTQTINVKPGDTVAATDQTLMFNDGKAHTLTIDKGITLNCDINVINKNWGMTSLTIGGNGTIKGTGTKSVINVEYSNLIIKDNVHITGGVGQLATFPSFGKTGGGILVQRKSDSQWGSPQSKLTLEGGVIEGNSAESGGGIFIDYQCDLEMKGGTIKSNTATTHEGGGLFIFGKATIAKGSIIDNQCLTSGDWGGGGIFVNSGQTLTFTGAATITGNSADGLGGGISGCPHAEMGIGEIPNGFALYGNSAAMSTSPTGANLWYNKNGMGDIWAYEKDPDFNAADAQDFYCVYGSYVYGQHGSNMEGLAYTGRWIEHDGTNILKAEDAALYKGESLIKEKGTVGLTAVGNPGGDARPILISGNHSNTHGGGIGCNGTIIMGAIPTETTWNPSWSFTINKELLDGIGQPIRTADGQFSFGLYTDSNCTDLIATASNNTNGTVEFTINDKDRFGGTEAGTVYELFVKEIPGIDPKIEYDDEVHAVHAKVTKVKKVTESSTFKSTYYESRAEVTFDENATDLTITNEYIVEDAVWAPTASKAYYGSVADPSFGFSLQAINDPMASENRGKALGDLIRTGGQSAAALIGEATEAIEEGEAADLNVYVDDGKSVFNIEGTAAGFSDYEAAITFPEITYKGVGNYWYVLTENAAGDAFTTDPSAYVMNVEVVLASSGDNNVIDTLKATQISLYYAEDLTATTANMMPLTGDLASIEFVNFDQMEGEFGLYSFAVNAITEQPVASDQRCLVDPKIYKVLEGRQLKDGQFNFSLVQVGSNSDGSVNWADTSGAVISTAANDQYGMVDFDAANNQAGEGEEPCCLVFTAPGTYHYRVVEVAGSQTDPSIDYSKEIITFTAVIEGGNGQPLTCTDMYYGKVQNGQNVRFDESADPTWHPTMTNKVRPMELKVRKTSELDRNEGLEGATYGLYLVSTEQQNDVKLGEATSDTDGWMTFPGDGETGLNLKMGNLYYFKEIAAPSQHTVSQFRSLYFYITPDPTSEVGYALKYTDTKASVGLAALASTEGSVDTQATGTAGVLSDDKMLFTYDYDNGVFDEATAVTFNKLDGRTHEWVQGATLAVIDKDSGQELESWVTGDAAHQMVKKLDVDKVYILRELSAPTDYNTAKDIEFKLDAYGNLEILSGMDNKNAEQSENTLTMFDFMVDAEMTLYEYNEREEVKYVDPDQPNTTGGDLVQTGDKPFPIELVIAAVAALGVAGFAVIRVRRRSKEEQ